MIQMKLFWNRHAFCIKIEFSCENMNSKESNFGIDLDRSTSISAEMATFTGGAKDFELDFQTGQKGPEVMNNWNSIFEAIEFI